MADQEAEKDARTVFVRSVSYDVDQARLEEVFADIGPVRQCFLVTEKGKARHKGIAFVQFAIPEDADRAVQELNGRELAGRKLKIEHARKRAPLQERKQRKRTAADSQEAAAEQQPAAAEAAAAAATNTDADVAVTAAADGQPQQPPAKRQKSQLKQQEADAADKHKWVRTVALGGLHRDFVPAALELAAAAGGLVEVLDPPPADVAARAHLDNDGCSGDVVLLVYSTVKEATHAVTQLHGKAITPADIAAAAVAAAEAEKAAAAAAAAAGASSGKGRKGKPKLDKKAAKQLKQQQQAAVAAAAAAAGTEGGVVLWARHVAGEGALVKKWRLILRNLPFQATEADVRKLLAPSGVWPWQVLLPTRPDGRLRGFAFASFLSYHEAEKALAAANGQLLRKRPVAADWALAKEQYEQQLKGQAGAAAAGDKEQQGSEDSGLDGEEQGSDQASEGEGSEDSEDEGEPSGELEGSEEEGSAEEFEGSDEEEGSGSDEGEGSGEEEEEQGAMEEGFEQDRTVLASALDAVIAQQQQQPAAEQKQDQQKQDKQKQQALVAAGGDAAADGPKTGAVACTVFVRGLAMDTTSQELQARFDRFGIVKACRVVMDKATGKPKGTAFVEFKSPAGAAAAAAACARAREGKGPDVMVKGVKLSVDLALTQDDARRLGQAGGQTGSNGVGGKFDRRNMYLAKEGFIEEGSPQWLSMSENDRRKRKRAAEEKNQKLKSPNFALSTTRLAIRNIPASWDEKRLKAAFIAGVKARATKENPVVKQSKILRDPERPDAAGHPGGKSRGFGFVEFADHSHALAALRQLNNHPTAFGKADRRPIVEFAVDNVKVLKSREDKLEKQKQQQRQKKGGQQQAGAERPAAAAAAAAGKKDGDDAGDVAAAAGPKTDAGDGQQQQQQQQQQQLSKRQLKRLKEKQKKLAKQQRQQANGTVTDAGNKKDAGSKQQQQQQRRNKQGKKGLAADAATAAAAAAKATHLAAKAQRQQQQLLQEEAVRGRKRRADEQLDRLAALDGSSKAAAGTGPSKEQQQQQQQDGDGDSGKQRKRHKPGRAQEEKLERMVQEYKSKLFGLGGAAGGGKAAGKSQKQQQQQQRDSMKRWFE